MNNSLKTVLNIAKAYQTVANAPPKQLSGTGHENVVLDIFVRTKTAHQEVVEGSVR